LLFSEGRPPVPPHQFLPKGNISSPAATIRLWPQKGTKFSKLIAANSYVHFAFFCGG
jgi:hypothetical protein